MRGPLLLADDDFADSRITHSSLARTTFEDVDLTGATFHNINLRGVHFSAVDFGGSSFSCVNTGEGRPRQPVVFTDVELHNCIFRGGSFANVEIIGAEIDGMKIGGVLVSDLMRAYQAPQHRAPSSRPEEPPPTARKRPIPGGDGSEA